MHRITLVCLAAALLSAGFIFQEKTPPNALTPQERRDGWRLLFDGKTTAGWRRVYATSFPEKGWLVRDGTLTILNRDGKGSERFGDIVTETQYGQFDLRFEFRLTERANGGVKYFVTEDVPKPKGSAHGLEFQVLDDDHHPDAKRGQGGNRTAGSLYDLIPAASTKRMNPIGQWNQGRILVRGSHVEHWLNGQKVLEYERGGEAFRTLIAGSKYAAPEYNAHGRFGEAPRGHILLQDHGDEVAYRNLKIKVF